jgi:hypothetical protein
MGSYHTFFVARDEHLDRLFPGWKRAKPEQELVRGVNPFTKEKIMVPTWAPIEPATPLGKPSLYDDVWGPPVPPIIEVENDYMAMIEDAGPPGLRARPHFRAKNCDPFAVFDPLVAALVGGDDPVPPARIGCSGDDDVPNVWVLPDAAAQKLAATQDRDLPPIMQQVLLADVTGSRDTDTAAREYYVERGLRPLRALAIEAGRSGARVCHYYALHH